MRSLVLVAAFALAAGPLHAQQPASGVPGELAPRGVSSMGSVPTRDALVTGGLEVHGDTARLLTNTSITAYDHPADISLARGGQVLVCSTSQFHLLHSGTESSLLFGLDRGAIELHTDSSPQDVILTPDIRFTLEHPGHYDLRLRVTPNGDTCVENRGTSAPVLSLADPFSGASYRLIPGQHVLFEHGSLHEVVDNERSPCGCPPVPPEPVQQIAAPATNSNPTQPITPATAAAQHPFPAAASQGLAPTPSPAHTTTPAGQQQTQIATIISYDAAHPNTPASTAGPPKAIATSPAPTTGSPTGTGSSTSATPPPTPPGAHDIFHSIGHFFHKLFHPHSEATPTHPATT